MPSSLVAPQTPAWVVTGRPRSRATSKAAFSGNAGSPVTSKASWRPSSRRCACAARGSCGRPGRRSTPRAPPGCCRRRARSGRAPTRSASTAASAWSALCSPCDQSTVVVTPASSDSSAASRLPAWMSSGRKCCRARGSTRRSTGSASSRRRSRASRSATCAGGCRSCPGITMPPRRVDLQGALGRGPVPVPTSAIGSSTTSTSASGEHRVRVVHGQHGAAAEEHRAAIGAGSVMRAAPALGRMSV